MILISDLRSPLSSLSLSVPVSTPRFGGAQLSTSDYSCPFDINGVKAGDSVGHVHIETVCVSSEQWACRVREFELTPGALAFKRGHDHVQSSLEPRREAPIPQPTWPRLFLGWRVYGVRGAFLQEGQMRRCLHQGLLEVTTPQKDPNLSTDD